MFSQDARPGPHGSAFWSLWRRGGHNSVKHAG